MRWRVWVQASHRHQSSPRRSNGHQQVAIRHVLRWHLGGESGLDLAQVLGERLSPVRLCVRLAQPQTSSRWCRMLMQRLQLP